MKIAAHTLIKNEENFVWYSVMSVLPWVDHYIIYDTGSNDKTTKILEYIKNKTQFSKKIELRFLNLKSFKEDEIRLQMLNNTSEDWFIVVDGDEIWWDDSIRTVTSFIRENYDKYESIIVPTVNMVGDLFHYQESIAGNYKFGQKIGHYNLRAVNRKIEGLSSHNPHGTWGWVDNSLKMIQDRDMEKIKYLESPYMHTTFLRRSASSHFDKSVFKRSFKFKYELGIPTNLEYYFPEVFFRESPEFVNYPFYNAGFKYKFIAFFETPLRKIKRRFLPKKVGY